MRDQEAETWKQYYKFINVHTNKLGNSN